MNNRLIVIGITGVARSGKDTIAGILCQRFGFTRIALADGVRSAFRDLDGPTWERTKEIELAGKTSRWALQQLGTEARWRAMCPSIWMDLVATKITYLANIHPLPVARFVIPDVRFAQEVDHLRNMVGIFPGEGAFQCWKVVRPGAGLSGELAAHASEREIAGINGGLTIVNDSSIERLETVVSDVMNAFLKVENR